MTVNTVFGLIFIVLALGYACYMFYEKCKYISTLEGNCLWGSIVDELEELIVEAEQLMHYGTDKKKWVMEKIKEKIEFIGIVWNDELEQGVDEAIETLVEYFNKFKKGIATE